MSTIITAAVNAQITNLVRAAAADAWRVAIAAAPTAWADAIADFNTGGYDYLPMLFPIVTADTTGARQFGDYFVGKDTATALPAVKRVLAKYGEEIAARVQAGTLVWFDPSNQVGKTSGFSMVKEGDKEVKRRDLANVVMRVIRLHGKREGERIINEALAESTFTKAVAAMRSAAEKKAESPEATNEKKAADKTPQERAVAHAVKLIRECKVHNLDINAVLATAATQI